MLAQNLVAAAERSRDFPCVAEKSTRRRVLIVDDERLVRWSVAEKLTERGIVVAAAADARSAMQSFGDGEGVDLVLLDLRLPDSDDLGVLAWLRYKAPQIPVILMTAFATREIIEDAAALGAFVVAKPFDMDVLATEVEGALDGRIY
jgi:DNA-binding NtrC family response regulator